MVELLPEPEPKDGGDRKVLADIAKYGVHVTSIPPEGGTPGWAFSIGLFRTQASPEIIVFGLEQSVGHSVVNDLARRARSQRLEADQVHSDLLEGFDCVLKPVQQIWYRPFVGYAGWYYRHQPFPVLQCIWPDRESRYPWDPLFFEPWLEAQPLLYLDDPQAARTEALLRTMQ